MGVIELLRKFFSEEASQKENPYEHIRISLPDKHKKKVRVHLVIALENFYTCAALFDTFSVAFPGLTKPADIAGRYCLATRDCYLRYLMQKSFRALFDFFEGISALIASSGIPKSEVPYQKQFSTQALSSLVAKACTSAQLLKSAQKAAKQLRHDLSRDAHSPTGKRALPAGQRSLLVELWHTFILALLRKQYEHYNLLASECYGDTMGSEEAVLPELDVPGLLAVIAGTEGFDSDDDGDYEITMTQFSNSG
jgi:Exocyst complex component Sec3, C-terminal